MSKTEKVIAVLVVVLFIMWGYVYSQDFKECKEDGHKDYECKALLNSHNTYIIHR